MDQDTLNMLNNVSDFLSNMIEKITNNEFNSKESCKKAYIFHKDGSVLAEADLNEHFNFHKFITNVIFSGISSYNLDIRRSIQSVNRYPEYHIKSILLVDDEPDLLDIASDLAICAGHYVECYNNSKDAYDRVLVAGGVFDIAIIDYWMPDIKGDVLGECLNQINPLVQVIYYTGDVHNIPVNTQITHKILYKPSNLNEIFLPFKVAA